jgi:CAAX protease family protein
VSNQCAGESTPTPEPLSCCPGELALPIGLHFGWDFVQGFVFGVVAAGKQYGSVLVLTADPSATLWTGQPYGAEGGLIGTAAFIAGFLATFAWARRTDRRGDIFPGIPLSR